MSLDVTDLDFSHAGLVITLRKSKIDQEGRGRRIGIPYSSSKAICPVRSLQAWLEAVAYEGALHELVAVTNADLAARAAEWPSA